MGRIVGAFGIQGWVKVLAFSEEAARLGDFDAWQVHTREGWKVMQVEGFEVHSKGPVAKLAGCGARDAAQALRGSDVALVRAQLGEPEKGMLYRFDLVGLEVVDAEGEVLGKVESFFEAGDASVMVVRGLPPRGQDQAAARERMIPFVRDYVVSVDREARRITVDWKPEYDA